METWDHPTRPWKHTRRGLHARMHAWATRFGLTKESGREARRSQRTDALTTLQLFHCDSHPQGLHERPGSRVRYMTGYTALGAMGVGREGSQWHRSLARPPHPTPPSSSLSCPGFYAILASRWCLRIAMAARNPSPRGCGGGCRSECGFPGATVTPCTSSSVPRITANGLRSAGSYPEFQKQPWQGSFSCHCKWQGTRLSRQEPVLPMILCMCFAGTK